MQHEIGIVKDFTATPGGRFRKDGPHSGEQFREEVLQPLLQKLSRGDTIRIDFDGAFGYPISFLEEAFGGLARANPSVDLLSILRFKSDEEPSLIDSVKEYIHNARS